MRKSVHDVYYGAELFKAGVVFRREALEEQGGSFQDAVIRNQCFIANGYFGSNRADRKMALQICLKLAMRGTLRA
ncbi:hypothetical protein NPIL_92981 [Nephila pilipes]|uniref:Uncharacterized protein n=1 Tax=Nephila pilipes TaxID=299642 RepID=A0A8X6I668_NEPPI|nr:hypothetical protein NPIL_92981 [Nephila pilipes]